MPREGPQRQSEEVRGRILDIARRVVSEEGVEALSIRRITKEMGYSAGIVYHYFENKEQLLSCVLQQGYARILDAVKPPDADLPPDEMIRAAFTRYVESALTWAAEYRALMFSSSPQVLAFTSVLGEGMCEARPALSLLVHALELGITQGLFAPCDAQLTAQALWSAVFGLLARLLIERDVAAQQRSKLLNRQIDILMKGLRP